jgi:hypothetical protein
MSLDIANTAKYMYACFVPSASNVLVAWIFCRGLRLFSEGYVAMPSVDENSDMVIFFKKFLKYEKSLLWHSSRYSTSKRRALLMAKWTGC